MMTNPGEHDHADEMAAFGGETEAEYENKINELNAALTAAQATAEEQRNMALRARADVENMRRRFERDVENAHKYALEKFVAELVPVVDGMSLGLNAVANPSPEVKKFLEGSLMTLKMLVAAMEKFGVKEVNPVGEKFNPDRHLAMSMQASAEHAPNTVLNVVQKGYMLADRLIRPAMVVVAKAEDAPSVGNVDEMA
ncbi:MAG: nucleotide exchange factor GrpE [Gammaproteobacteria bacterium]|nr:nucleotide exchange factor GrpE [Gammaproteobacteria bacterium]